MESNKIKNRKLGIFDLLLLVGGIALFFFVGFISYGQLSHHRLNAEVEGFILETGKSYPISGYLHNKKFTEQPSVSGDQIGLEKTLPYIGEFIEKDGNWSFKLSQNNYSAKDDSPNNLLFPRAVFKSKLKKLNENTLEPLSEIPEEELLKDKLVFIDRSTGSTLLELWMANHNGIKAARTSTIVRVALNLRNNGDRDSLKLIEKNIYTVSEDDPSKIILLSQKNKNSAKESLLTIVRKDANQYVLEGNDTEEQISRKHSEIVWNGWILNFTGIYSWTHILILIFALAIGLVIYFRMLVRILETDTDFTTRVVETRVKRIFSVYILFSVLSIVFINHTWLTRSYERSIGFGFMMIMMILSWIIVLVLMDRSEKEGFYETKSYLIRNSNNLSLGSPRTGRYWVVYIIFVCTIFLIGSRTHNERFMITSGLGIPILHISKIFVCIIVFLFRKSLFKGELGAHFFLWSILGIISLITGDFSSFLFSACSYTVVSILFSKKILLPNIFRIRGWFNYYKKNNSSVVPRLLANTQVLSVYFLSAASVLILLYYQNVTKIYRFILPYTSPSNNLLLDLSNQHKETYAKMFWTLDHILKNPNGTFSNFRTVNFFTTWHTDLAFLSWLQYGGIYILSILIFLFSYLLYDSFYILMAMRKLINANLPKDLEEKSAQAGQEEKLKIEKATRVIYENIFVYFLIIYLLVQTFYPVFSNLNLLPMIGSPIPCLSVSFVEYLLTPVILLAIYFYTGRIMHHNDLFQNESYKQEELKANKFQKDILHGISLKAISYSIFLIIGTVLLFSIASRQIFASKFNSNQFTIVQRLKDPQNIERIIRQVNAKRPHADSIGKTLLLEADKEFHSINSGHKWINSRESNITKRQIIRTTRDFIFRRDLIGNVNETSVIHYNEGENQLYISTASRMKERTIHKSLVLSNITFENYFDLKSSKEIGDMQLSQDAKISFFNNKLHISAKELEDFTNPFFETTRKLPTTEKYLYDGETSRINYKIVNGSRIKVLRYPALGDIELLSDTFDADLQAIITLYLEKYISVSPEEMKLAGMVIAENKTGNIIAMAGAPSFANQFGKFTKEDFSSLQYVGASSASTNQPQTLSLFSFLDPAGLKNFSLAQGMVGSTIKPIYTFAALADPNYNLSLDIPYFITKSDPAIAKQLFMNEFERDTFQRNLFNFFDLKVFDSVRYHKDHKDSPNIFREVSSLIEGEDLQHYNQKHKLSKNALKSAAWGQGSINMSLTGLVRNYIRIKERAPINLKFYKSSSEPSPASDWKIDMLQVSSLYEGMHGVISSGTASKTIKIALIKNGLDIRNYMGKTGTSQFPRDTNLGIEGKNRNSFMLLVTPNYTIGVLLAGVLPNGGQSGQEHEIKHAKGVLQGIIDLLARWRKGEYLT